MVFLTYSSFSKLCVAVVRYLPFSGPTSMRNYSAGMLLKRPRGCQKLYRRFSSQQFERRQSAAHSNNCCPLSSFAVMYARSSTDKLVAARICDAVVSVFCLRDGLQFTFRDAISLRAGQSAFLYLFQARNGIYSQAFQGCVPPRNYRNL